MFCYDNDFNISVIDYMIPKSLVCQTYGTDYKVTRSLLAYNSLRDIYSRMWNAAVF